ncbi:hypothetical protein ABSA28_01206 [Candidatus Hepatincolaceae symbiont of Richtersius coronifer]
MNILSKEQFKKIAEETKDLPAGAFVKRVIEVTGIDPKLLKGNENGEITKKYRVNLSCDMESTQHITITHPIEATEKEIKAILEGAIDEEAIDWEPKYHDFNIEDFEEIMGKEIK